LPIRHGYRQDRQRTKHSRSSSIDRFKGGFSRPVLIPHPLTLLRGQIPQQGDLGRVLLLALGWPASPSPPVLGWRLLSLPCPWLVDPPHRHEPVPLDRLHREHRYTSSLGCKVTGSVSASIASSRRSRMAACPCW
jgi:hypothetical protein